MRGKLSGFAVKNLNWLPLFVSITISLNLPVIFSAGTTAAQAILYVENF